MPYVSREPTRVHAQCTSAVTHEQCADALHPVGNGLVLVCTGWSAGLFDPYEGKLLARASRNNLLRIMSVAVDEKTGLVVFSGQNDNICLTRIVERELTATFEFVEPTYLRLSGREVSMVNSVRFHRHEAGSLILVVGHQDGYVYGFDLTALQEELRKGAEGPSEGSARRAFHPSHRLFEINALRTEGQSLSSVNIADISPDGKKLAAAGDASYPVVWRLGEGFAPQSATALRFTGDTIHSQYLSWNRSSTLLAVSSDSDNCVYVGGVVEIGDGMSLRVSFVAHLAEHRNPVLPVSFSPDEEGLLAWAEQFNRVYCCDVTSLSHHTVSFLRGRDDPLTNAAPEVQPLPERVILAKWASQGSYTGELSSFHFGEEDGVPERQRFTGLCFSRGSLFCLSEEGLFEHAILPQWSQAAHSRFPEPFKAAIRTLLFGVHPNSGSMLSRLSYDAVMPIARLASRPLATWATAAVRTGALHTFPLEEGALMSSSASGFDFSVDSLADDAEEDEGEDDG